MRAAILCLVLCGCAYQPEIELGAAYEIGSPVVGRNPVGVARFRQPLFVSDSCRINFEYEHLSSIPDRYDLNTVDQVGLMLTIPLGGD